MSCSQLSQRSLKPVLARRVHGNSDNLSSSFAIEEIVPTNCIANESATPVSRNALETRMRLPTRISAAFIGFTVGFENDTVERLLEDGLYLTIYSETSVTS